LRESGVADTAEMEIEGVKARRMRSDESLNERGQSIREAEDARESSDVRRTREN
jgi:hypothetical protein